MDSCGTPDVTGKRSANSFPTLTLEQPIFLETDRNSNNRNWEVVFNKFVYDSVSPYGVKGLF